MASARNVRSRRDETIDGSRQNGARRNRAEFLRSISDYAAPQRKSYHRVRARETDQLQHHRQSGNGQRRNGRRLDRRVRGFGRTRIVDVRRGAGRSLGLRPRRRDVDLSRRRKRRIAAGQRRARSFGGRIQRTARSFCLTAAFVVPNAATSLDMTMNLREQTKYQFMNPPSETAPIEATPESRDNWWSRLKKTLGPLAGVVCVIAKVFAKPKCYILSALQFWPLYI